MSAPIYMDYNATAPIRASVIDAVAAAMKIAGNPSSVHTAGRAARKLVEEARAKVAALVNTRPRDVTFCSGGTEASNAVIRGTGAASVIVSAVEHDAGRSAAAYAGVPHFMAPVDGNGIVNLAALEALLKEAPEPALVSVMLVNNETGVIQPVAEAAALAHQYGARIHTDAVQAAGKIMIDFKELGVDYLTLSAHKIGGPQGVGAIVTAPTAPLTPLVVGGGQELGRRSGTENVAGAAGFGEAAIEAMAELGEMERLAALRDRYEAAVRETAPDAIIMGAGAPRVATVSCVAMPRVKGETQVMHFDLNGICVSSGAACSSGKVKASHVLHAMGHPTDVAETSVRVSLGAANTEDDIDKLIDAWRSLYTRTHAQAAG